MRIARSLPDSTCKGSGDTGTGDGGTEGSMWSARVFHCIEKMDIRSRPHNFVRNK